MKKFFVILPFLLTVACSSDDSGSNSAAKPQATSTQRKSLAERMDEKNGYSQDKEGNWVPQNNKRSSFETNRESAYFKGDYAKKDFKTKDFSKKSWWGDTKYESKKYQGNTDGSRFETASRFQEQGARESGTNAKLPGNYKTGNYKTGAANEAGTRRLDHPSDAETDFRRKVYGAPSVIDWKEQRSMSVNQTKGILGN